MKKNIFIVLLVGLLFSGIYATAATLNNTELELDNVVNDESTIQTWWHNNVSPRFNHYSVDNEQHQQILVKKIELTNKYLLNYAELSSEERQEAETNYNNELSVYLEDLLGYEVSTPGFTDMPHFNVTSEEHEEIVIKRVELYSKYFVNYDQMTDDEKTEAQEQFRLDFQEFMQSFKDSIGRCSNYNGRQGKRYRHGKYGR